MTSVDDAFQAWPEGLIVLVKQLYGDRDVGQRLVILDPEDENQRHGGVHSRDGGNVDGVPGTAVDEELSAFHAGGVRVYLYGDPMYEPAEEQGAADWIMIGEAPGIVLAVTLAPPHNPDPSKCRPIGLDKATGDEWRRHREWVMRP